MTAPWLTNQHVRQMADLRRQRVPCTMIAERIGCSYSTAYRYTRDVLPTRPSSAELEARRLLRNRAEQSERLVALALSVFPEARMS